MISLFSPPDDQMNPKKWFSNTYCPVPSGSLPWLIHKHISMRLAYPVMVFCNFFHERLFIPLYLMPKIARLAYPTVALSISALLFVGMGVVGIEALKLLSPTTAASITSQVTLFGNIALQEASQLPRETLIGGGVGLWHTILILYYVPITRESGIFDIYSGVYSAGVTGIGWISISILTTVSLYLAHITQIRVFLIGSIFAVWLMTQAVGGRIRSDFRDRWNNMSYYRSEWWLIFTRSVFIATTVYAIFGGEVRYIAFGYAVVLITAAAFRQYRKYVVKKTDHVGGNAEKSELSSRSDKCSYRHTSRKELLNKLQQAGKMKPDDNLDGFRAVNRALSEPDNTADWVAAQPAGEIDHSIDTHPITGRQLAGKDSGIFPSIPAPTSILRSIQMSDRSKNTSNTQNSASASEQEETKSVTADREAYRPRHSGSSETRSQKSKPNDSHTTSGTATETESQNPTSTESSDTETDIPTIDIEEIEISEEEKDDLQEEWRIDASSEQSSEEQLLDDFGLVLQELDDEVQIYKRFVQAIDFDLSHQNSKNWGQQEVVVVKYILNKLENLDRVNSPVVLRAQKKCDRVLNYWNIDVEEREDL